MVLLSAFGHQSQKRRMDVSFSCIIIKVSAIAYLRIIQQVQTVLLNEIDYYISILMKDQKKGLSRLPVYGFILSFKCGFIYTGQKSEAILVAVQNQLPVF